MKPVRFPTGDELMADDYVKVVSSKVLPWINSIVGKAPFKQDGAPDHTSKKAQLQSNPKLTINKCILKVIQTVLITLVSSYAKIGNSFCTAWYSGI